MYKSRVIFQTGIVCILLLAATTVFAATKMPSFDLSEVVSGKRISSNSFEGKALLITFFATWCPPCVQEIPTLITLQNAYKNKGFSVVGLSVEQGNVKAVKKIIKKKSINYPVMMADSKTMQKFGGVYGIPVSFLVNKKGNVVKKYTGYIPRSILEKDLKKVL